LASRLLLARFSAEGDDGLFFIGSIPARESNPRISKNCSVFSVVLTFLLFLAN
jgi:hypothetical protein